MMENAEVRTSYSMLIEMFGCGKVVSSMHLFIITHLLPGLLGKARDTDIIHKVLPPG